MKRIAFCLIFIIVATCAFAQNEQTIESDLVKSFKRIAFYGNKNDYEKTAAANNEFAKDLKRYAEKYPFTITSPFGSLVKKHLNIPSSTDGKFRIYSWDTMTGGTMHFFANVFQYKCGDKTFAVIDTPKGDGDNRPNFHKVYTLSNNNKTYYLSIYLTIGSSKDAGAGMHVYTIENNKLNDAKLIKTKSGLHSELSYSYNLMSVVDIDFEKRPDIHFDSATNTIYLPLVDSKGMVKDKYIRYKFDGEYFERVKN